MSSVASMRSSILKQQKRLLSVENKSGRKKASLTKSNGVSRALCSAISEMTCAWARYRSFRIFTLKSRQQNTTFALPTKF